MHITLRKAGPEDTGILHSMQVKSFQPLLEIYRDFETSPANEPLEKVEFRINQPITDYYILFNEGNPIGGIRIVKLEDKRYRVSPIFVLPEYQGNGIAQEVFRMAEQMYPDAKVWELDTILEEKRNCHLYEKMGYKQTGKMKPVNEKMTIVFYEKRM